MARAATPARKIKIMISSQCRREFPKGGRTLTEIRQEIRNRLEGATLLGEALFEVWINEDAPAAGLEQNSWEKCLFQVRQADILIVLDAGHAGWALAGGDIGICHAELMTAHNTAPGKIRIIPIRGSEPVGDEDTPRNRRFEEYVGRLNAFAPAVRSEADLHAAVDRAVVDAVSSLSHLGVREARKGRFYSGDALEWSKLSFAERQNRMVAALQSGLGESRSKEIQPTVMSMPLGGKDLALHLHAAPAALTLPVSRERVGRPFLEDHKHVEGYPQEVVGPVHIIACQSGATESQARAILGFPDAMVVAAPFGIFVADETQQIQFALLKDCRDDTTTRNAVHRFLDWLREAGEDEALARRAEKRRNIANAIAAEL